MDKRQIESDRYIVNKFNDYKEFIKDKQVTFVIRKTERIVYGIYMLSRFIPSEESLAQDLKKTSHQLLESVSRFVSITGIAEIDLEHTHGHLQYVSSLLSLAFISGYVSSSNIEIMKSEINYLHKHIEELSTRTASETGQLHLKSDLFVVGHTKSEVKPRTEMSFIKNTPLKKETNVSFTKNPHSKASVRSTEKQTPSTSSLESKSDREKRILDVIRDKGVVSIKDISSVIFDIGEKTIQRTLQLLIDKGQIKKEGERRWAKYQLI
jgi:predicted transcriptional regulator